jgi:hypothetical protein
VTTISLSLSLSESDPSEEILFAMFSPGDEVNYPDGYYLVGRASSIGAPPLN